MEKQQDGGAVAVEFALSAPVLLALVAGIAVFSAVVVQDMRLEAAVGAGAQYAMTHPTDAAGIAAAVTAGGLDPAAVSVVVATTCGCADGSTVACAAVCSDGSARRTYATVRATAAAPVSLGGFGAPLTLTANATVRVQ